MKKAEPEIVINDKEESCCSDCGFRIKQDQDNLFRLYCPSCDAEWFLVMQTEGEIKN